MATDKELAEVFTVLTTAYPMFALPEETLALYVRMLSDIEGPALKAAALEHIRRTKFFPTVAELRELARESKQRIGERTPLEKIREWREQIPSQDEAAKFHRELKRRVLGTGAPQSAIVPVRDRSSNVVGSDMTEDEWQKRKRRLREKNLG